MIYINSHPADGESFYGKMRKCCMVYHNQAKKACGFCAADDTCQNNSVV